MNLELPKNFNPIQSQKQENLIFIDSAIEDYQSLISATSPNTELVMLDPLRNGILQITEELTQHNNIASIHIVSHGKPGSIQLGNTELNLNNFDAYAERLQDWSKALIEEADLLFYGCNIGANRDGETLINKLADVTNADIAASTNLTGHAALGGDWNWEINTGTIESGLAFPTEVIQAYDQVLASTMTMGHQNVLLDLVPHENATHIAIQNGGWFNPSTWQNGQIPGDGANVLIPQGRRVWYGKQSDARLDTLRVDGNLTFLKKRNTKMLIGTFVVSPEGKLNIGSENNPIQANRTAQIIFTSDTAIDATSDPKQLGKGLISHGQVRIYGADKLDFVGLAQDLSAGDNRLILDLPDNTTSPLGWKVGDQLVLGGTSYNRRGSDEDNSRFRDEVLTITAINGNKISFINNDISSGDNTVLRFDHQRPEGYQNRLNLYVANTTRNVIFETENGENVPINHRGHVMFMHNPNVVVQNAGFYSLGRTDKNKLIDDPSQNVDGTQGYGTNPRGRYSLHFHRTGADNPYGNPAVAKGNAVVGSPGWGIAHHDSHALLEDNVVFDVVGTGIAAEAGNEIGTWRNNITIKTTGDDDWRTSLQPKSDRVNRFDFGFNGDGYWVQGAGQIDIIDNIAISASETGFIHYGGGDGGQQARDAQTFTVANLPSKYQSIAKGTDDESVIDVSAVPIRKLSGFENYNSRKGISFWATLKNVDNQLEIEGSLAEAEKNWTSQPAHNFRSQADNFKIWHSRDFGFHSVYSSQITAKNGLIIGDRSNLQGQGIAGNADSLNYHFENIIVDGFEYGMNVPLDNDKNWNNSSIKNLTFTNNLQNFQTRKTIEGILTGYPAYFEIINSNFSAVSNNVLPTPKFTSTLVGGLAVKFDASASFDGDSSEKNLNGKGIVSYGWDFDNDGNIDRFGRQVDHHFNNAGSKNVTLTVWDNQGATQTLTKTINIVSNSYENLIIDGNFNNKIVSSNFYGKFSSSSANLGWHSKANWSLDSRISNGAAIFSQNLYSQQGLGQTILDEGLRRGNHTLSLRVKNTEGEQNSNQLTITIWGVNGEFRNPGWNIQGPQQVGAIPMTKTKLLQKTIGGSSFDWKNFSWDLNFGNGYQFVVFQMNPQGINPAKGDILAIDNIKIV
ncbi:MAG: hypothetical protein Tsb0014_00330 [Pleurocapsa sp.]